jgi:hypothetical protein
MNLSLGMVILLGAKLTAFSCSWSLRLFLSVLPVFLIHVPEVMCALTWKEELQAKDSAFSSGWICSSIVGADFAVTVNQFFVTNDQIWSGVSNSLETDITLLLLLLLLWLLPVTEAATHVSSLLLQSCIGGISSETLYHVKWCPSLSDKLCSHSLVFHLISLWQEEAQAQSLNCLFHLI